MKCDGSGGSHRLGGQQATAKLAEIHGWFTKSFGISDLKDAKAMLDELSA